MQNNTNDIKKLNAENVKNIFIDCIAIDTKNTIAGQGMLGECIFDKDALEASKETIIAYFKQLSNKFQQSKKSGCKYLNARIDKDGNKWGKLKHAEWLVALANALGLAHFSLPKDLPNLLPHEMPYYIVIDE